MLQMEETDNKLQEHSVLKLVGSKTIRQEWTSCIVDVPISS